MRRVLAILLLLAAFGPMEAAQADLQSSLTRQMRLAGSGSGAYVVNLTDGTRAFAWARRPAAHPRLQHEAVHHRGRAGPLRRGGDVLGTEVLGTGEPEQDGVWRGDLYLRGGGDPTFGSRRFATRSYGGGATVEELAVLLENAGIERVSGRIRGDESRHDLLRGGPDSGYGVSVWVGPLSALSYNRGLADEGGRAYQLDPPSFAAARSTLALERRGVRVRLKPASGATPGDAEVLASVDSPPMQSLVRMTNKASDNFFAELLAKDSDAGARPRHHRHGRPARRRFRPPARSAGAAGGRLGPRARQPRLALSRRAPARRHDRARRVRRVL